MNRARSIQRPAQMPRTLRSTLLAILISVGLGTPLRAFAQSLEAGVPYTASGGFYAPTGLGVDEANGRILVADTGNRRVAYAPIASLTGSVTWGSFGETADATAPGALNGAQGVAVDAAGNAYVADARAGEGRLYRYDRATGTYTYDPAFVGLTRREVAGVRRADAGGAAGGRAGATGVGVGAALRGGSGSAGCREARL